MAQRQESASKVFFCRAGQASIAAGSSENCLLALGGAGSWGQHHAARTQTTGRMHKRAAPAAAAARDYSLGGRSARIFSSRPSLCLSLCGARSGART